MTEEVGSDARLPADAQEKMEQQVEEQEEALDDEQARVADQPIEDDPGEDFPDPSGG